ncbi:MAG: hypothetical protein M0C28_15995 [Candidatus Moduliflexus flocculans]|nr:hypothetical protein [Candidatus Moduliflexus flocculans]
MQALERPPPARRERPLPRRRPRRRFHARHDAVKRIYRYRISRRRTGFGKPYVYWAQDALDVAAMERAARLFAGRHDFKSFCENPEGHDSTIVVVERAEVTAPPEADGLVLVRISASHFLWKMVRRVVGVLIEVGAGRMTERDVARLFVERDRRPGAAHRPALGLFLESVRLPGRARARPAPPAAGPRSEPQGRVGPRSASFDPGNGPCLHPAPCAVSPSSRPSPSPPPSRPPGGPVRRASPSPRGLRSPRCCAARAPEKKPAHASTPTRSGAGRASSSTG